MLSFIFSLCYINKNITHWIHIQIELEKNAKLCEKILYINMNYFNFFEYRFENRTLAP